MSFFKKITIIFKTPITALLVLVVSLGLIGGITPIPSMITVSFAILMVCAIMMTHPSINYSMLIFLLYLPFELLISQPDSRFQSWFRLCLFIIMMLSISPLLQSKYSRVCRYNALRLFVLIIVVISIASFFAYFLGINMMIRYDSNEYLGLVGHFSGFYQHSMQLGPMSSIACLFLLYKSFVTKKKWYLVPAALCAICVMFSASRGSFIGLLISACFLLFRFPKNKIQLIESIVVAIVIIVVTYPLWKNAMSGLEQKQEANIEAGGMMMSREEKWTCRISEFKSSPIFGIGFASVDPDGLDYWDTETGGTEPGSSWLAILSMTGLVGFILFLKVFINSCSIVKQPTKEAGILSSFLIFFAIHSMSEGYIFAAGGPLCILFWLVLACCIDKRYESKLKIERKD